ncbi:hypothetical protein ACWEF9_04340 [Streptomyces sp. NPDC004980]
MGRSQGSHRAARGSRRAGGVPGSTPRPPAHGAGLDDGDEVVVRQEVRGGRAVRQDREAGGDREAAEPWEARGGAGGGSRTPRRP